jgi:RES domain-containing protein
MSFGLRLAKRACVSLVLWRICLDHAASNAAEAFSGIGAAKDGGRWHHEGRRVVYCSTSQSAALLEVLADLPRGEIPRLTLFRAEVPDDVVREEIAASALPAGWRGTPPPRSLRDLGASWLDRRRAAMLVVPSAIIPDEPNVLLSPLHDDFRRIALDGPFALEPDPRFFDR